MEILILRLIRDGEELVRRGYEIGENDEARYIQYEVLPKLREYLKLWRSH